MPRERVDLDLRGNQLPAAPTTRDQITIVQDARAAVIGSHVTLYRRLGITSTKVVLRYNRIKYSTADRVILNI